MIVRSSQHWFQGCTEWSSFAVESGTAPAAVPVLEQQNQAGVGALSEQSCALQVLCIRRWTLLGKTGEQGRMRKSSLRMKHRVYKEQGKLHQPCSSLYIQTPSCLTDVKKENENWYWACGGEGVKEVKRIRKSLSEVCVGVMSYRME